ncbi:MAG: cadherin-like beta sandwich domain-containing protein [Bacilli bacterium]|nr:cadherin-like beta sandwich domain-containing protein [Bacilli bacterium]
MKKIIFTFLLISFSLINIKAASISYSVDCGGSRFKASSDVKCSIYVKPTDATLTGAQMNYSFTNATFKSFDVNRTSFHMFNTNASLGASLQATSSITKSTKTGTLVFKAPSSGTFSLKLSNLQAATSSQTLYADAITKNFTVMNKEASLTNLTLSNAELSPSFSSNVYNYTATINSSSTTITATKKDSYSKVSGTGKKTLSYGENVFKVVVTSEDGTQTKTYKITITRPDNRETINTLSGIKTSNGVLSPSFSKNVYSYKISLDPNVSSITITPTKEGTKSTFVSGYSGGTFKLNYGDNKVLIKVKSESGKINTYTIVINRRDNRNTNNYLKTLKIENANIEFDKNTLNYSVIVKNNINKINIMATTEHSTATVSGIGEKALKEGSNKFEVKVKAENETIRTYTINIKRLTKDEDVSSNTNLKELQINNYPINFNKSTYSYTLEIGDETSLDIKYSPEDITSIVNVNGNTDLKDGSVITIKVTSTDGSTKDYIIRVTKTQIEETGINTRELLIFIMGFALGAVLTSIISLIALKKKKKVVTM